MALRLHRFTFKAMACRNELSLYSHSLKAASVIAREAIKEVNRLELKYSRYLPDSMLSMINARSGQNGIIVDSETAALLDYAQTCYYQSRGLFDITSGVLRRIWDFESNRLPDERDIERTLKLIGWEKLDWTPPRITLPVLGMELDFGGIVKEYAADSCAKICRNMGVKSGLVNMGGDIQVIGPRPNGSPWTIGIQNPTNPERAITSVELKQGGLASSGDYQRYMRIDGKRYSHILNPMTGWPVQGLRAVSVIGPNCLIAGSTSTIAMLNGEQGKAWLESTGMSYIWIDENCEFDGSALPVSRHTRALI